MAMVSSRATADAPDLPALEVLDAADLNRVVTAINRSAILNKRAALASAFSAACFALRFAATLLIDLVELG